MTAINFPDSPSDGDTHVVGGVTYTYNNAETKWKTTINSNAFLPLTGGTVSGNILMGGEIQHDGDTDTNIAFDTDTILFDTAGSERFRVGSAGQLGIGGATYGTSGQVLTSGGASAAPTWEDGVSVTHTNTNISSAVTGVTIDSIPSTVTKFTVTYTGLTTSASATIGIEIGDSGGLETSGYAYNRAYIDSSSNTRAARVTSGSAWIHDDFALSNNAYNGSFTCTLTASNTWVIDWTFFRADVQHYCFLVGRKSLSGTLDRVRMRPASGNFSAGNIAITYIS